MSRRPLLRLNSKEKHTLIFITEEGGCRIPQRVRTSSTSASTHQPMDTDAVERRISVEAAARYAHTAPVHGGPTLSCQPPPLALPQRASRPLQQLPLPPREPSSSRLHPVSPQREPPPPRGLATLEQPRSQRKVLNEYVETPHRSTSPRSGGHLPKTALSAPTSHGGGVKSTLQVPGSGSERHPASSGGGMDSGRGTVITTQPTSSALKKVPSLEAEESHVTVPSCSESIICSQCGKCRCQACTQPRELPRRWLCNNKCECSVQKVLDVCTCLCLVRACFYHCCFKDLEGDEYSASDDPCACCEQPLCCKRWMCLGVLSLCLPCLCLYWPMCCGLRCCTSLYNRCTLRGCRCRRDKLPGSKRLLIDSESSST